MNFCVSHSKHFLFDWYSGAAIMDLVGVFSSIEDHHMNTVSDSIIMRAAA